MINKIELLPEMVRVPDVFDLVDIDRSRLAVERVSKVLKSAEIGELRIVMSNDRVLEEVCSVLCGLKPVHHISPEYNYLEIPLLKRLIETEVEAGECAFLGENEEMMIVNLRLAEENVLQRMPGGDVNNNDWLQEIQDINVSLVKASEDEIYKTGMILGYPETAVKAMRDGHLSEVGNVNIFNNFGYNFVYPKWVSMDYFYKQLSELWNDELKIDELFEELKIKLKNAWKEHEGLEVSLVDVSNGFEGMKVRRIMEAEGGEVFRTYIAEVGDDQTNLERLERGVLLDLRTDNPSGEVTDENYLYRDWCCSDAFDSIKKNGPYKEDSVLVLETVMNHVSTNISRRFKLSDRASIEEWAKSFA